MKAETITERDELVIRRMILAPGEKMYWHTDLCHRFTVPHGALLLGRFLLEHSHGLAHDRLRELTDDGTGLAG